MNEDDREGITAEARWSQALAWYVTLRQGDSKDLSGAIGRRWAHWHADAENRRIFDDLSRLLAGRDLYRVPARPTKQDLAEDCYDLSVPVAQWRKEGVFRNTRVRGQFRRNRWWRLSGSMGLAALAVLFIFSPLRFGSGTRSATPVVYQTNVGGLKYVHLPDGSSIILGGRTKLSVVYSTQRRSVSLIEGQAWFRVAHNPRSPFIVAAGDNTVTDVGTAFLVTRETDRVVVTVTEGTVEVSARPYASFMGERRLTLRPALASIRVNGGEELAVRDNGMVGPIKQADTRAATAWTQGRLTFDNQPLRYVVEEVDRYSSRRIVVSPSAGALRFSGIVLDNDIGDWLQSLKAIFPVSVEEQGAVVHIQIRDSSNVTSGSSNHSQR